MPSAFDEHFTDDRANPHGRARLRGESAPCSEEGLR